jgi:hypothetical protein
MDQVQRCVTLYSDGTKRTEFVEEQLRKNSIPFRRVEWPWSGKRLPAVEAGNSRYQGLREIRAYFLHGR